MAGLSTAYSLLTAGQSVVVLDAGPIGGGMTERTTAHLSNVIDDGYVEIERLHGKVGARRAAENRARLERVEKEMVSGDDTGASDQDRAFVRSGDERGE